MSAASFEYLLENAFGPENPLVSQIKKQNLYETFIAAEDEHRAKRPNEPDEKLALAFERLRLGIGAALIQVFARLSENPDSQKVVELFLKALNAKTTEEIDQIMHSEVEVFENLYTDVFVNKDREEVLALFEKNLEADSRAKLNAVLREGLALIDDIDWDHNNED